MPQITLKAAQVVAISDFAKKHNLDSFFLAKDQGAYIGINATKEDGKMDSIIHYFKGCNPNVDDDFYHNAYDKFGGDDFGENLSIDFVHKCAANPKLKNFTVKVSASSIKMEAKAYR